MTGGRSTRTARAWALALLVSGAVTIVATHRDYGITWDESVQAEYGDLVLAYFTSRGADARCNEFLNLKVYAPLFDLLGALAVRLTGGDAYEVRHLLIAVTGLATVLGVFFYTLALGGTVPALAAALAQATMPRFHGNAFNNPKDVPLACALTWAMLALTAWLAATGASRRKAAVAGLAIGLALAVRPGAFPLLVALVLAGVVWRVTHPSRGVRGGAARRTARQLRRGLSRQGQRRP